MSDAADWAPAAPQDEARLWEMLTLMADVVEGIAAVQRELVEAVVAVGGERRLLAGLAPGRAEEALFAQADHLKLDSMRLISRAQELAARAEQLKLEAERIVSAADVPALRLAGRARVPSVDVPQAA